jgi:hypothetical protein
MKCSIVIVAATLAFSLLATLSASDSPSTMGQEAKPTPLASKLDKRIAQFDASGHTLVAIALELSCTHKIPLAIEYADRYSTTEPIDLRFSNQSLREIFVGVVSKFPTYRVSFSDGLVTIYSPAARADKSNLLNTTIKRFNVTQRDTRDAETELFCALLRETKSGNVCSGSTAPGQWGTKKITVDMEDAKVYEILNAVIGQNGEAVWTVAVSPEQLSKLPAGQLWHIYPLEEEFKTVALSRLSRIQ